MEFQSWPKTPRLNRDITITEKIDGTNAAIIFEALPKSDHRFMDTEAGRDGTAERHGAIGIIFDGDSDFVAVGAQSRKRLIYPNNQRPNGDNAGFAAWVWYNAVALYDLLGPGRHFGEWWGKGIQRGYGLETRAFSLFNAHRYKDVDAVVGGVFVQPVPVLYQGPFSQDAIHEATFGLTLNGSAASETLNPDFQKAEGIIIHHSASNGLFKVTLESDEAPKGLSTL